MAIVITGGTGFVGGHLVAELRREVPGVQIVVWDKELRQLPAGVAAATVDITDAQSYRNALRELKPTWIIHLAAIAPIGESYKHPELVHAVNVVATHTLLEAVASLSPATKVLVASSADIYGYGTTTLLPELPLHRARPHNPYAKSKWEMERMIEASFNDRVIRVRPFPHIGPRQQRGFVTADFASQIAAVEAGQQPPVIKVGNTETQRDFTDVRDVVRAYRLLLTRGNLGEVYHVASGVAVAIQTILDQLLAAARVPITVDHDPLLFRPTDIPVLVGDATKLRASTGWEPQIPLAQSLQDILEYWREKIVTGNQ